MKIPKLPAKMNTYLLIGIGGLVVFFVFVIYPYHRSLAIADLDIKTIQGRIEEQKILFPVFMDLLKKSRIKETKGLPFPEKAKLARDEAGRVSSLFQDIAQRNHFKLINIIPEKGGYYLRIFKKVGKGRKRSPYQSFFVSPDFSSA